MWLLRLMIVRVIAHSLQTFNDALILCCDELLLLSWLKLLNDRLHFVGEQTEIFEVGQSAEGCDSQRFKILERLLWATFQESLLLVLLLLLWRWLGERDFEFILAVSLLSTSC